MSWLCRLRKMMKDIAKWKALTLFCGIVQGKSLKLLSGSRLLYLLKEHAGIEAKIQMLENWKDPLPDM